ncbi:RNA polymerase sigma factor [Dyadobacter arcticus]|uniref:RNA polymerase sigma-70 factor (ECF subfamily) n=1 Tax=Dyadobacter arcticus TaxID=1078754 RepID=A0ABX0UEL3_9BACT|nr:sigma-70 family RNA polymerase sigma factor [Dyadobacter arcticus]NIJ51438.1 RNA polymerase sigma-70 factor (ECF subfamily) [Dyadobacter arcticus]
MRTIQARLGAPPMWKAIAVSGTQGTGTIIWNGSALFYGNFASLPVSNLELKVKQLLATSKVKYSEEELVLALKRNERTAFEFLYDHYSGALFNIISKTLRDEERAADVLQESFLKIWKNIASYNPEKGRLFTWIMNIARNGAIDAVRVEGRKPAMDDIDDRAVLNERDVYEDSQNSSSEMKAIINMLRPERKILIDMAYFQGYTHEEISEELSIPLGTVKSRIRTALQELKQYFAA